MVMLSLQLAQLRVLPQMKEQLPPPLQLVRSLVWSLPLCSPLARPRLQLA